MADLVNREIFPSDGVALGRVCACSLCSRLVFTHAKVYWDIWHTIFKSVPKYPKSPMYLVYFNQ